VRGESAAGARESRHVPGRHAAWREPHPFRPAVYARHYFSRRAMNLFGDLAHSDTAQPLSDGAVVLRGFVTAATPEILAAMDQIAKVSPFRHMVTPGGFRMSVAMTNCGNLGWVSEPSGYRYDTIDPETGQPWPEMPPAFLSLARRAASAAGYDFDPDGCLINRYAPG